MARTYSSLSGVVYGNLTIIGEADRKPGNNNRRVKARCICGSERDFFLHALRSGNTKTCGCAERETVLTHGHTANGKFSPEYYSWSSMKTRCTNSKSSHYSSYGGRGITFCERWTSFQNFLEDMGSRPYGTTLERENVNGNYEKSNCIWATKKRQSNNKRDNTFLEHAGKRQTISEWAEETGIAYNTIIARIHRLKWTAEEALTKPPKPSYQR